MNPIAQEIYATRQTIASNGQSLKLNSSEISPDESRFLARQVESNPDCRKTLEIGCAFGLSSLAICHAMRDRIGAHHTIVDPFQSSQWQGAGVQALRRAGFNDFSLVEELSEIALPSLLKEQGESFDLVFVDGWHTFDHTLLDCFYALRLLKVGGRLVVDDCDWPSVAKVFKYISQYPNIVKVDSLTEFPRQPVLNWACRLGAKIPLSDDLRHYLPGPMKRLIRRPNMICLQKTALDERSWTWYAPF
jgi:predicted O-methyltransferase YrrM